MTSNNRTSWYVYCYFDRTGAPIYVGIANRDEVFQVPQSYLLQQAIDDAGGELPVSVIREGGLTHGAAEMILRGVILAIGCKPTGTLLNDPDLHPGSTFHCKHEAKRTARMVGNRMEYSFDGLYRSRVG